MQANQVSVQGVSPLRLCGGSVRHAAIFTVKDRQAVVCRVRSDLLEKEWAVCCLATD